MVGPSRITGGLAGQQRGSSRLTSRGNRLGMVGGNTLTAAALKCQRQQQPSLRAPPSTCCGSGAMQTKGGRCRRVGTPQDGLHSTPHGQVAQQAGRRQAGSSRLDATLLHSGQAASQLSCKLLCPCPVLATYAISVGASQALSFTSPCASAASKMEAATRPGLRDTRQRSVADHVSIK